MNVGSKIVTDGLVLHLDSENIKSYPGEPTVNLAQGANTINVVSSDIPNEVKQAGGTGYLSFNSGYYVKEWTINNIAATGKTFNYSIWLRSTSEVKSTYGLYVWDGTGGDGGWWNFNWGGVALTNNWKKLSYSNSNMTGTINKIAVYRGNSLGTLEMCGTLFEEKSHATSYVNGTRNSAWMDLSGNGFNASLSNAVFDSYGKIDSQKIDGKYINIPYDSRLCDIRNSFSFVAVALKRTDVNRQILFGSVQDGSPWNGLGIISLSHDGNGKLSWWSGNNNGAWWDSNLTVPTNQTIFCGGTWNGTLRTFYLGKAGDNVLSTDTNNSNAMNCPQYTTNFTLFGECDAYTTTTYLLDGKIYILRIYNRELTSSEMHQQFNSIKKRFSL